MLYKFYDEILERIIVIDGYFVEHEQVTVTIWNEYSDRVLKRKVHWDGSAKDLYISIDGIRVYYDFVNSRME